MLRKSKFVTLLASSALTLAVAGSAFAGTSDRAREAIAAADAKLNTATTMGAGTDSPREVAQAQALLASAHEDFKSDHREAAIQEAIQASALADTAIGLTQKHKDQALAMAHENQRATTDAARDQVAAAQDQAAAAQQSAQQQVADAQQQAKDANARADSAQQSAAASAADAADARSAAAIAAQTPAQVTVTTQQATNTRHPVVHKKVVQHTTAGAPTTTDQVTTTTTVTPQ